MNDMAVSQAEAGLNVVATSSAALILDSASMDSIIRLADIMAKGRATVPSHLQGNPADCGAIIMQAIQWRMNPYAVAQKTHVVNGALGYEAQLVNAVIQSSGVTEDRLNYEWFGPWENIIGKTKVKQAPEKGKYGDKDYKKAYEYRVPDYGMADENGLGVRVWATVKGESQPRLLELLLVQASVRNSPLWATDPKQQLAYLATKRWARLHTPDVILGVYTPDELEEFAPRERDITPELAKVAAPVAGPSPELLARARTAADKGLVAFDKVWKALTPSERGLLRYEIDDLKVRVQQADTVQADPAAAPASGSASTPTIGPEYDDLIADMGATADEGTEAFEQAWASLSKATQAAIAGAYPKLAARAAASGVVS